MLQNLIFELHLLKYRALALEVADRVRQPTFAIHSIFFEVIFHWEFSVACFPTKSCSIILAVNWHASFPLFYSVLFIWVPAVLIILAFCVFCAHLVLWLLITAGCLEGPCCLFSAVKTNVAFSIISAIWVFVETNADILSFVAISTHALVAILTKTSRKQVLSQSLYFFACSIKFFLFKLWITIGFVC